jgi:site-specific recombinase XerD
MVTTNYRIFPYEWDNTRHCLLFSRSELSRKKRLVEIEQQMHSDLQRLETIIRALEKRGHYTMEDILSKFCITPPDNMISSYTQKLSKELVQKGQSRTARAYRTAVKGLIAFNDGKDLLLEQINSSFLTKYEIYLKNTRKNSNTIAFYMRNIKAIYHKAVQEEMIQPRYRNPFGRIICAGLFPTWKQVLTKEEIRTLFQLELSLTKADLRDSLKLFMFCFYAQGMSFIDLAFLKKENIRTDQIGYVRKKTGQFMRIHITDPMRVIIDYFGPMTGNSKYVFPVIKPELGPEHLQYEIALQHQNKQLKILGKMAHIDIPLSTHMARHAWANIACLEAIPLPVISEALGHPNRNTTMRYVHSFLFVEPPFKPFNDLSYTIP